MSIRLLVFGALAAVAAAVLALWPPTGLEAQDLRVYDMLLGRATIQTASSRVAVVAIDERSLAELGQWPWSREVMARLVEETRTLGASVIAIDAILAEPDRGDVTRGTVQGGLGPSDAALARTVAKGDVVLGYALTFDGEGPNSACALHPLNAVLVAPVGAPSPAERMFHASGAVCSLPAFTQASGASGFLNVGVDTDGVLRRAPLVMTYADSVYPSLALEAVRQVLPKSSIALLSTASQPVTLQMGARELALDSRSAVGLRFHRAGAFPLVSAADVLARRVPTGTLDGRVVFVGATAAGARDFVATPFDRQLAGILVHATVADNLLDGSPIAYAPFGRLTTAATAFALAVTTTACLIWLGPVWGSLATVVLVVLTWLSAAAMMIRGGVFLSPLYSTVGAVFAAVCVSLERLVLVRRNAVREKRRRQQAQRFSVHSLTSLMEMRDPATGHHALRTQGYARLLSTRLAQTPRFRDYFVGERIEFLSLLAPLHDIGKVGVRDAILGKPGPLTLEERQEMQRHPALGYETILKAERRASPEGAQEDEVLALAKDIVYTHHERWDGTGYPRKLAGDAIPVAGRVVALVDVYDALVEPRPYRARLSHEEAAAIIAAGRGSQFDPDVVDAFLSLDRDFRELSQTLGRLSA